MIYRYENSVTENTTAKWNISNLNSFFFQTTDEESPSGSISPPPDGGSVNDWVFLPQNLQTTVHTSGMNVLLLLSLKNALYVSVNIFSAKVLIGDTIFYVSYWRRVVILRGHPTWSEPREGLAVCRTKKVHSFLSYLRLWVVVRSRESNPWPPALQSSALSTE